MTSAPPRILYCCPPNLLDITSGAALSAHTLLAGLVKAGWKAVALQASIFDSPQGGEHVMKVIEGKTAQPVLRSEIRGVEHLVIRTASTRRRDMTCQEEEIFFKVFMSELEHRRPDMILLWGSLVLERAVMREARDAGIPVMFFLVNPGYKDKSVFKDVSLVITDSQGTADLYRQRFDLPVKPLGKFIEKARVVADTPPSPEYITFINPSFEKGVSVFMPLARLAARECPEIRFLVVESRGLWGQALSTLNFKPDDFPNVRVIGHQTDMRPIYSRTRALLLPSLWHESGARVISEALLNGIPVLASNTGGSAEIVGAGGRLFELSHTVREHMNQIQVSDEDLRPWLEEIKRLWHDADYAKTMRQRALQEAEQHDVDRNVARLIETVKPLLMPAEKAGNATQA